MSDSIDLGVLLDGFDDEQPRDSHGSSESDPLRPQKGDLTTMPTSDAAAAKAKRRKRRGDPPHKIRMVPLAEPHATPRRVYPDWL